MAEASPLSIRLGADRLARIERHMARKGLTVRAAVVDLVDVGLSAVEAAPEPAVPVIARRVVGQTYHPGAVTAEALRRLRERPDE